MTSEYLVLLRTCSKTKQAWPSWRRALLLVTAVFILAGCSTTSWRDATRESANIAPLPSEYSDAIVQVYAADTWGWRGIFAVHTWISVKPSNADTYTVLEVVGWRAKWGVPVLRVESDLPDRHWYGAEPELVYEKRGEGVDEIISQILEASLDYPWANEYVVFPGPNSN
ncbi:hypothetical protein A3760_29170, partial [Oleiphilus sp. HI0122]